MQFFLAMNTWLQVLIAIILCVLLGCITGVFLGKYQIRKARKGRRPVLSPKQRVLFLLCITAGIACILAGVLLELHSGNAVNPAEQMPGVEHQVDGGAQAGGVAKLA